MLLIRLTVVMPSKRFSLSKIATEDCSNQYDISLLDQLVYVVVEVTFEILPSLLFANEDNDLKLIQKESLQVEKNQDKNSVVRYEDKKTENGVLRYNFARRNNQDERFLSDVEEEEETEEENVVTNPPTIKTQNQKPEFEQNIIQEESKKLENEQIESEKQEQIKEEQEVPVIPPTIVVTPEQDLLPEPELVQKVRRSLSNRNAVSLCEEGVGGTYFIHDEHDLSKKIAIFKPSDEEPGSPSNPKRALSKPLLPPGGGAKREVAAYILDNGHAGVPETHFVENISHPAFATDGPKSGSVQKFEENVGDSGSMSSTRFSVQDVHSIAILDLRLFNMDRNEENILVKKLELPVDSPQSFHRTITEPIKEVTHSSTLMTNSSPCSSTPPSPSQSSTSPTHSNRGSRAISSASYTRPAALQALTQKAPTRINRASSSPVPVAFPSYKLVPIDHTYSLPPSLDGAFFEWQYWRQAKENFSDEHINYIKNIDPSKDAEKLRKIGIEEGGIRTMMISSWLLKLGVEFGMTLAQIAQLVTRRFPKEESILEKIVSQVERNITQAGKQNVSSEHFIEEFVALARKELQKHLNQSK